MNRAAHEPELSDAELVRQSRSGQTAAFGVLVARYQDRVFNTCYRICHRHADALDLTQATFLRAFESLERFESRARFYTWLFRIAVNLAISHCRRARRRPVPLDDDDEAEAAPLSATVASREPGVVEVAVRREETRQVEQALAQLDEEHRAVLVLKDIEEMDYATIAEVLDVPVGTVKSRIHRGRLRLYELMHGERTPVD